MEDARQDIDRRKTCCHDVVTLLSMMQSCFASFRARDLHGWNAAKGKKGTQVQVIVSCFTHFLQRGTQLRCWPRSDQNLWPSLQWVSEVSSSAMSDMATKLVNALFRFWSTISDARHMKKHLWMCNLGWKATAATSGPLQMQIARTYTRGSLSGRNSLNSKKVGTHCSTFLQRCRSLSTSKWSQMAGLDFFTAPAKPWMWTTIRKKGAHFSEQRALEVVCFWISHDSFSDKLYAMKT